MTPFKTRQDVVQRSSYYQKSVTVPFPCKLKSPFTTMTLVVADILAGKLRWSRPAMRGLSTQICVLRDTQNEIIEAAGSLKGRGSVTTPTFDIRGA